MERQDLEFCGDDVRLTTTYSTDDYERANAEVLRQAGKGFIRDGRGNISARLALNIPMLDAAMLEAKFDPDWMAYTHCQDRQALRRLLKRFPYWRVAEGRI